MVRAMADLLRWARPGSAALLTLALGINGFVGAIHSVHHLPAPGAARTHTDDSQSHRHDGQDPTPAGAQQGTCPVATAVLHLAAIVIEGHAGLERSPAGAELVALGPREAPRAAWREPARGRAPPSRHPLPS